MHDTVLASTKTSPSPTSRKLYLENLIKPWGISQNVQSIFQKGARTYPPRPSVPKSSEKMICTLRMNCRDHSGSKIRLEKRSTDRFSTSSLPR